MKKKLFVRFTINWPKIIILFFLVASITFISKPSMGYSISANRWYGPGKADVSLSYFFGTLTPDLPDTTVKTTLSSALNVWAEVVDITFTEVSTPNLQNSIDFLFATGDHGDLYPFSAGVLAHTFLPCGASICGDVHFNDAYLWEVGNGMGFSAYDLMYVAVHEIGHSLGLYHSDIDPSLMWPYISGDQVFTGLFQDDIDGILSLYAPALVPEPSTVLLLGSGLAGLTLWRRRISKSVNDKI